MSDPRRLVGGRLRRLRREGGWPSAQALADACGEAGALSLTRSALAKVEAGMRKLGGDEAVTLARVLGVTPADLLEPATVSVFLSYAGGDDETVRVIADDLTGRGVDVVAEIDSADAFLIVPSPGYLGSQPTRREYDLAERRDRVRPAGSASSFIHVLRTRDTPPDAGKLHDHDWFDVTSPEMLDAELSRLIDVIEQGKRSGTANPARAPGQLPPAPGAPGPVSPTLGARQDDLNRLLRGLMSARGPHFWLVIGPPGLGKTTFLDRVSEQMAAANPRWVTSRVDIRRQPADARGDAMALLARFFGIEPPFHEEPQLLRGIAQDISRRGQPHLCLLDGAELLAEHTPTALRSALSRVYRLVQRTGNADVRLAFVVASRRDDEWRGVTPDPRVSVLPLSELDVEVVEDALRDLAGPARRGTYSNEQFHQIALFIHWLTEGLPALLDPFLDWIRAEEWLDIERLEERGVFDELAGPYIDGGLLARDSLFPQGTPAGEQHLEVVKMAVRMLTRYRLFTQSHLRHHLEQDGPFQQALDDSRWSVDDLWAALSRMSLLERPLDEPWQEFHAPIRRLLFRYFYQSPAQRAEAHREARKFVEIWAERQSGKEQVIGMVECLWHEASALRLEQLAALDHELSKSARELSGELRQSGAYSVRELRSYAAERIADDEELHKVISDVDGLTDRLIQIVAAQLWESRA